MTTTDLNPFEAMLNTMDLYGWSRGKLVDSKYSEMCFAGFYGHVCSLRAEFDTDEMRTRMAQVIHRQLPRGEDIFHFNDQVAKDDAEIRETLKHCAMDYEEHFPLNV